MVAEKNERMKSFVGPVRQLSAEERVAQVCEARRRYLSDVATLKESLEDTTKKLEEESERAKREAEKAKEAEDKAQQAEEEILRLRQQLEQFKQS